MVRIERLVQSCYSYYNISENYNDGVVDCDVRKKKSVGFCFENEWLCLRALKIVSE